MKGVPDILGILPDGRFLGIEVKAARGRESTEQAKFRTDANARGAVVFTARSIEDVKKALGVA